MCPENKMELRVLGLHQLHDQQGFLMHCEIAACLIEKYFQKLTDPAVKHHIRGAIREATKKVVTSGGGSQKDMARLMSESAKKHMKEKKDLKDLEADHAVPVSVINKEILDALKPEGSLPKRGKIKKTIIDIVLRLSEFCVITKEEHRRLSAEKLGSSMPKNWEKKDRLARYKATNIEVVKNEYTNLKKAYKTKSSNKSGKH